MQLVNLLVALLLAAVCTASAASNKAEEAPARRQLYYGYKSYSSYYPYAGHGWNWHKYASSGCGGSGLASCSGSFASVGYGKGYKHASGGYYGRGYGYGKKYGW